MRAIQSLFGIPLGWVMWLVYKVVPHYWLALLIFTLITRLIMIPSAIKQQKSQVKNTIMQPRIKEIQDKYKDDKEKQSEEMQKFYKEEGFNPLSGCLPLLIQMPLLFGLIDVVYKPLTHILRIGKDAIAACTELFLSLGGASLPGGANNYMIELDAIRAVKANPAAYAALGSEVVDKIVGMNYGFFGLDLMVKPEWGMITGMFSGQWNWVVLIPIFSGLTSLLMALISNKSMPTPEGGNPAGMSKMMTMVMPVMSFVIAFNVPAAVGLYWTYTNVFAILQSLYMNKKYNIKELAEKAKEDQVLREKELKQKEKDERAEARKLAKEGKELTPEQAEKAMTQKEINRKKLAEARRRDAERYGEEYIEVDDSDL